MLGFVNYIEVANLLMTASVIGRKCFFWKKCVLTISRNSNKVRKKIEKVRKKERA